MNMNEMWDYISWDFNNIFVRERLCLLAILFNVRRGLTLKSSCETKSRASLSDLCRYIEDSVA